MSDFVIFGGLHDSLDHRQRFQDIFRAEIRRRGTNPRFIAVEWREEVYRALTLERPFLENRLRERWEDPDDDVVRLAGESLCWEADAHLAVANEEIPVVYLDGLLDRQTDEWAIRDPKEVLIYTKSASLVTAISKDAAKSVQDATAASNVVSWSAVERKMPRREDREVREPAWAEGIAQEAGHHDDGWAAAVVGAVHATRFDRYSLPCQLDRYGITSTPLYLTKPTWANQDHCDRE